MTTISHVLRVLIADDHALFRAGLRALLEGTPGVEVTGETADGREAVRLATQLQPDIVLMDVSMPECNGLMATARMARECPSVRVLILSMHSDEEYVAQALRAGAAGYLLKSARRDQLEIALHTVVKGDVYLCPRVAHAVSYGLPGKWMTAVAPLERLTARQREVLQLLAEGLPMKAVAHRLGVSVKTVETHRAQLMERLDIHDVPGLVRFAIRTGVVRLDN